MWQHGESPRVDEGSLSGSMLSDSACAFACVCVNHKELVCKALGKCKKLLIYVFYLYYPAVGSESNSPEPKYTSPAHPSILD